MIEISIDPSNDAFDDFNNEVARILHKLADEFAGGRFARDDRDGHKLLDINGGGVGTVSVNGG